MSSAIDRGSYPLEYAADVERMANQDAGDRLDSDANLSDLPRERLVSIRDRINCLLVDWYGETAADHA